MAPVAVVDLLLRDCVAVVLVDAVHGRTHHQPVGAALPSHLAGTGASADWIVVLGGGLRGAYRPLRPMADLGDSADRVRASAQLFNAGKSKRILVTGGALPWNALGEAESLGMTQFLIELGVPSAGIWLESESQTTYENALKSAPILTAEPAQTALLVTSAFHMHRSLAVFEKQIPEIQWIPYATDIKVVPRQNSLLRFLPDIYVLTQSQQFLREQVGLWVYKKRNWT